MSDLDNEDRQDFEDVERGFNATLSDPLVRNAEGVVVWDADAYDFIHGEAPATVSASLWRQGELVARRGLFEVVPGIYQGRRMDISNISFVEGDTGVIVIDPLMSTETAAAALPCSSCRRARARSSIPAILHSSGRWSACSTASTTSSPSSLPITIAIERNAAWL